MLVLSVIICMDIPHKLVDQSYFSVSDLQFDQNMSMQRVRYVVHEIAVVVAFCAVLFLQVLQVIIRSFACFGCKLAHFLLIFSFRLLESGNLLFHGCVQSVLQSLVLCLLPIIAQTIDKLFHRHSVCGIPQKRVLNGFAVDFVLDMNRYQLLFLLVIIIFLIAVRSVKERRIVIPIELWIVVEIVDELFVVHLDFIKLHIEIIKAMSSVRLLRSLPLFVHHSSWISFVVMHEFEVVFVSKSIGDESIEPLLHFLGNLIR
mmetsp:Transcript_7743/g.12691  ORF Transcript_7743/g.12691 Transcript_7743/m.12691 type:complete len:259 (+) Transcript_7743:435-1211(+)